MASRPAALAKLAARKRPSKAAIDRFLAQHEFPLRHGRGTTFVYYGAADQVNLRHWIYGLPTSQPFERMGDSDLWHLTLELPAGSRIEYKLEIESAGDVRWIRDPLNPLQAHDPYGSNSVCQAAGYEAPEWAVPDAEAREGSFEKVAFRSEAFGEERQVTLYVPPRFRRTRRYPLLIVHDGGDYLRYSALKTVLDNLIYRLEIAPLLVCLTESADRLVEYAADPRHATYLADELLAHLEELYPLAEGAAARGLMGASFGAVASLSTAWRRPGTFGRLLLQSGSFAFTDIGESRRSAVFDPVVEFMNRFREAPGEPSESVYMSCGTYESLIYENRSLVPLLQATGMNLRYTEARDGHNWENWRDRLREGLSFLFPGPLWMVYE